MKSVILFVLLFSAAIGLAAEPEAFHSLLDREWDYSMKESPVTASLLGDRRWNDRWQDISIEAMTRRNEHAKELLASLGAIDRAKLGAKDQVSYDLFRFETQLSIDEFASRLWTLPINQRDGIQLADDLADALRFETVKDYEDWIARLRGLPHLIRQTIGLMRIGIAEKRTHARHVMESVPGQIRKQIVGPGESPFHQPFMRWPAGLDLAEWERLETEARSVIKKDVTPAYQELGDFVEHEYLPACTEQAGAWLWPDGEAVYAFATRKFTTTRMSPREIHELGLREVERITQAMDLTMEKIGWRKEPRAEFFERLRGDKRLYYNTSEELLEAYRATAKRIDPTLVKVFKTLPRAPYGVEAIPANAAPNTTAAYYRPLAADGSRPGTFFVNLYRPQMRPRYEMMALAMHEAVPGHHFQFAIAFEQGDLPNFRRYGDGAYTAFVEGWALYSESLGDELGLYDDPYSKFGQLTYEIWRACRLVVDTGIHTMKWTRQQAIDYLLGHSAKTVLDVENEIDRYISWPGQALAYKVGELKIKELRARAANVLGDKFDVREFHDMLLREGALPLEVLETQANAWMEKH